MEKLMGAFMEALSSNPLIALVLVLVMGNLGMAAVVRRLFTLYVAVMDKRIEEGEKSRSAIAENTRFLERIADILKVSMK
jgi:hypothetical protein